MKKLLIILLSSISVLTLSSCQNNDIRIGVMPHLSAPIVEFVKDDFYELSGRRLVGVSFDTFDPINPALVDGGLHANMFQHRPYLENFNQANGTNLEVVELLFTPMYSAWSTKLTNIAEVPNGAGVVIQLDASNQSRGLLLLANEGLIELEDHEPGHLYQISDITRNDKELSIQPVASHLIPSALDNDDIYIGITSAVNAVPAGLPERGTIIAQEAREMWYDAINVLAVRNEDKEEEWVQHLRTVLTSEKTHQWMVERFAGTVLPFLGDGQWLEVAFTN